MSNNLPLELVDLILQHLSDSPDVEPAGLRQWLSACCLVCWAWKEPAQTQLLNQLMFYPRSYNTNLLHEALIAHPHLRRKIRRIRIGENWWAVPDGEQAPTAAQKDLWPVLLQVQEMALEMWRFDKTPPVFYSQICSSLSSTNLTTLALSGMRRTPTRLFYHCTSSLRTLYLRGTTYSFARSSEGGRGGDEDEDVEDVDYDDYYYGSGSTSKDDNAKPRPDSRPNSPAVRKAQIPLQHLYISNQDYDEITVLRWFLRPDSPFDLSHLKTFYAIDRSNDPKAYQVVQDVLARAAGSLEAVALDPPTFVTFNDEEIDQAQTMSSRLTSLLCIRISLTAAGEYNYIPYLIAFLSSLPRPHLLEEIQLPYTMGTIEVHITGEPGDWKRFDGILMAPPPAPALASASASASAPAPATATEFPIPDMNALSLSATARATEIATERAAAAAAAAEVASQELQAAAAPPSPFSFRNLRSVQISLASWDADNTTDAQKREEYADLLGTLFLPNLSAAGKLKIWLSGVPGYMSLRDSEGLLRM